MISMPHRRYGNDNIRTSHLKCDRCRTRVHLKSIEQSEGHEIRSFECRHCGTVRSMKISPPAADWPGRCADQPSR